MKVRKRAKEADGNPGSFRGLDKNSDVGMSGKRAPKRPPLKSVQASSRRNLVSAWRVPFWISFSLFWIFLLIQYWYGTSLWSSSNLPRAITPLAARRVSDLKMFQGKHREQLFWGTYRPQLYFGVRSRTPKSLLAGLMWLGIQNGQYVIRHTCEESDKLTKYGWIRHDGSTYGYQEVVDNGVLISTSFLKSWDQGSGYGGDWAVQIKVKKLKRFSDKREQAEQNWSSLLFYIADESGAALTMSPEWIKQSTDSPFVGGFSSEFGGWEVHTKLKNARDVSNIGFYHPHMHNLTRVVHQTLELQAELVDPGLYQARSNGRIQLPSTIDKNANVAVFQVTGDMPLELDVIFVSNVRGQDAQVKKRLENLSGNALTKRLVGKEHEFEGRFEKTFQLQKKVAHEDEILVGQVALSNLLGGMGYFYGQSQIAIPSILQDKASNGPDHWLYWPAELYTAVPSRSFFPRGFLWDEGFHQLVISRWDRKISMDVIGHWLDLINVDGWIPREQILGAEARRCMTEFSHHPRDRNSGRSKVPKEFINQHTSNANPPTLFLVLHDLARKYISDIEKGEAEQDDKVFFSTAFARLKVWFNWFNTTQTGKFPGTYYWHGRDALTESELNPKTLTSGLDDYPRASHPTDDERHLDLRCWMAHAAKTMVLISQIVGEPHEIYAATALQLSNMNFLNQLHFDHESGHYCDFGNHTENVELRWKELQDPRTGYIHKVLHRVVLSRPELSWIPQFGYVNLFPLLMQILPADSPILGGQLQLIHDHKLLWTDFGLRSLANTSSLYMKRNTEHDPPYWRGPVWININYLVLSSLHHYSQVQGPNQETAALIYSQLRENLIRNIVLRYNESGYMWENYDNTKKGKGKGSHPFTGWTSLILLIMAESY